MIVLALNDEHFPNISIQRSSTQLKAVLLSVYFFLQSETDLIK